MPTPPFESQIAAILKQFCFAKVHCAMIATNWVWRIHDGSGQERVPTYAEIFAEAERLLRAVAFDPNNSEGNRYLSTGGFMAAREDGWLCLEFTLESKSGVDLVIV